MSDAAARQEVRTSLDTTLFVEAGAGTGKTTVLVDRIVNLVKDGVEMRTIAAITFTEAAATELRDRIRAELIRAAAAEPSPRLTAAIDELDEAAISTLHAFAQRILSEHALEAGLPPAVEVLDEIQSALAFDERWTRFLDELLSGEEHADVVLLGTATGLRLDALRELALILSDHWDRVEDCEIEVAPKPVITGAAIVTALERGLDGRAHCFPAHDNIPGAHDQLQPYGDQLRAATDEFDLPPHITGVQPLAGKGTGHKGNWGCDIDGMRTASVEAETERNAELSAV